MHKSIPPSPISPLLGWQIPGGGELFSAGIDRCVINTEALVLNFEKIQVLA